MRVAHVMTRDPVTGVQVRIGVMGSAGGGLEARVAEICRRLGRAIAEHGCCLLTGACPGLPREAVFGAKEAGGHVVGETQGARRGVRLALLRIRRADLHGPRPHGAREPLE